MLIRIDARRLVDAAGLHAALGEAFGFTNGYGKNLDALVDCLTSLDNPKAALSRIQIFPGHMILIALENYDPKDPSAAQVKILTDVVAFVNWRRLEKGQPPVLAMAYEAD